MNRRTNKVQNYTESSFFAPYVFSIVGPKIKIFADFHENTNMKFLLRL